MTTLIIDIEQLPEFEAMNSVVVPFILPPVVHWEPEKLPDFIKKESIEFPDWCCCSSFTGFSGGYYNPQPVPEVSTGLMFMAGVLFIGLWKKFYK